MLHLYFFGEGLAEQTFADTVLAPRLATRGIMLHAIRIANSTSSGVVTCGGGRNYARMKKDIERFQRQNDGPEVFFTTMIDLYAIPTGFPNLADAEALKHLPRERVEKLELDFAVDIPDPRFIPHVQLHEFETILLCDSLDHVSNFRLFDLTDKQIASLAEIASCQPSPELIDDGPQSAPSKRIQAVYPRYEKLHGTMGPELAQLIGLPAIRAKCPHFDAWITKLENLAPLNAHLPLHAAPGGV